MFMFSTSVMQVSIFVLGILLQRMSSAAYTVDLTTFTTGDGALFIGSSPGATVGRDLAIIGDHNGDGFNDYMLSSMYANRVVIIMKRNTTNSELSVNSIISDQYYRVIKGPASTNTGSAVGGIGDINGDSFDDVIIVSQYGTVSGRSGTPGYAFVIFGMEGPFTDLQLTATWPASSLGFMILGAASGVGFGQEPRVARGLGDVNGDGLDDFAICTHYYKGTSTKVGAGVVWLIFGRNVSAFTTIDLLPANFGNNGVYYTGAAVVDEFGTTVMPAGDFNGDGIADFLIGAVGYDPFVNSVIRGSAGAAYLIHGSKNALNITDMSTFVTGTMGVRFLGAVAGDNVGLALNGVGDVNGDGIDDIAVVAPRAKYLNRDYAGIIYVIFGGTFTSDVDFLYFTDFSKGFAIYGYANSANLRIVAPAGDINQDGVGDVLVGEYTSEGRTHIVYGQTAPRTAPVDLLTANVMTFSFPNAYLGSALDGGKDLNGDGIPDLLLGGYYATVTPQGGGTAVSNAGAVWMMPGPFIIPTPDPSATPTAPPSLTPSADPSASPSVSPSAAPSALPSVDPSTVPSALPSAGPSAPPTETPSTVPTVTPSVVPSVAPSVIPSASPSVQPSVSPTSDESPAPSINPSAVPSMAPSPAPSVSPTELPSTLPSVTPSVAPSALPSPSPSAGPTMTPTAGPSVGPTIAPSVTATISPTVPALLNYELTVNVEQQVTAVTKAEYDAQQAAYNKTIQHTVAAVLPNVPPERVTSITVVGEEEEEEETRKMRANHDLGVVVSASTASAILLKYQITVFDPVLTVEKLRTQLVQAAQEGKMDEALHLYAAQFGAIGLNNSNFGEPQVTSAAVQRDASEQLTGVQIVLLVIGIFMCLGFVAALVWYALPQKQSPPAPVAGEGQLNLVM